MAKKFDTMQGTIEKAARNGKAFLIEDEWYSVYKVQQANGAEPGDYVEFEYEIVHKGGQDFRNIQGNLKVAQAEKTPDRSSGRGATKQEESQAKYAAKEKYIIRENVLRHATAVVMGLEPRNMEEAAADIITVAEQLEAWVLE